MNILTPDEEILLFAHLAKPLDHGPNAAPDYPPSGQPATRWKAARNLLACSLMLDAGLRVGELISLLTSDLYFYNAPVKTLTIRAAIAKGKRPRTIPLSLRILTLARYFRPQPSLSPYLLDSDRLITHKPNGHALDRCSVGHWRAVQASDGSDSGELGCPVRR